MPRRAATMLTGARFSVDESGGGSTVVVHCDGIGYRAAGGK
jgi:hypothetical protein